LIGFNEILDPQITQITQIDSRLKGSRLIGSGFPAGVKRDLRFTPTRLKAKALRINAHSVLSTQSYFLMLSTQLAAA
jgi:hypothetical protein